MPLNDCQCEDIITLKVQANNLADKVNELKIKDSYIGEIHSDNKKILEELKDMKENIKSFDYIKIDYPNTKLVLEKHLTDHNNKNIKTSDRNWGLWMVLITTIVSSIVGLIVNLLK